jgi:VWFA-related protein
VVNRLNLQRTAFLASMIILGTCGAGGQTAPLRDPSVAQKPLAPLSATDPVVRDGLFSIDLAVADSSRNRVSDLTPSNFTLLDNGRPAIIRTFHGSRAAIEPAPEVIIVLDGINLSSQQLTQTESAVVHFLQRNNGRLDSPCFVYRLTPSGLFSSLRPTRDGNLLAKEAEKYKSPRTMWRIGRNGEPNPFEGWGSRARPNPLSPHALGSIAIDQREIRGRKVVVWIGPGWPVHGGDIAFDDATELSTRLREARITLDNVNVWPNPDQSFNYHDYLEAPRSQKEMQPANLALQVIATHTGGLVLDSSGDLDREIERCFEKERSFDEPMWWAPSQMASRH